MDSSSAAASLSSVPAPSTAVHLLVLIHGMWGCPRHLAALKAAITAKYPQPDKSGEELDVLVAERIQDRWTYDGIDWNGERVTDEVRQFFFLLSDNSQFNLAQVLERVETLESENKKVTKLSITGYSLGGMIARYMIG